MCYSFHSASLQFTVPVYWHWTFLLSNHAYALSSLFKLILVICRQSDFCFPLIETIMWIWFMLIRHCEQIHFETACLANPILINSLLKSRLFKNWHMMALIGHQKSSANWPCQCTINSQLTVLNVPELDASKIHFKMRKWCVTVYAPWTSEKTRCCAYRNKTGDSVVYSRMLCSGDYEMWEVYT